MFLRRVGGPLLPGGCSRRRVGGPLLPGGCSCGGLADRRHRGTTAESLGDFRYNRAMKPDPTISRDDVAAEYFESLPYEPYPVQEEALLAYFTGETSQNQHGVLVCAPTGTGKTLIAEAAVYEALRTGTRMYYTTPLIALTDQKLDELRESAVRWGFDADQVGLVTGNRSVNARAPVLVVVAEILMNRLLSPEDFSFNDVSCVVMDEFHSFNDRERGIVWEMSLAMLPKNVRTLLLSATVGNSLAFTSWLNRSHGRNLKLVQGTERKVPLQFEWVGDELLPDFIEQISAGDPEMRRTPALLFSFSRSQCWTTAELLRGKSVVGGERQKQLAEYLNAADMSRGVGPKLKSILMRGIGVHHAGVLPRYRRIVEDLFQQKLLGVCVCTETLAAGINLPARSVVLPSIMKGPKDKRKLIDAAQAQQIFGRAGRPQFDDRGYVYVLAHEDDVKLHRWRVKYDEIPEDTKDPGLMKAKKKLKKKMPKRREGETYWSQTQFEQLQTAKSADLVSRGRLPWRLLAYWLAKDPQVQPIRDLVGRRLMGPTDLENAGKELNRMLITLWKGGYVELEPQPVAAVKKGPPKKGEQAAGKEGQGKEGQEKEGQGKEGQGLKGQGLKGQGLREEVGTGGVFGGLLDLMRAEQDVGGGDQDDEKDQDDEVGKEVGVKLGVGDYEVEEYRPVRAVPTETLGDLVQLRSVNPLFGVFVANHLAVADEEERILAMESMLEVPGTVARFTRVPRLDEMPAGTLATTVLDPELLQRGLATSEEIAGSQETDENDGKDRGFGRVMFDEPRVWPLTLGEKLLRLFRDDFSRVDDVRVTPVWIAGELLQFGGDFDAYVTARKLQKEEGILFRHLLRMILLCGEMAEIPPEGTTVETWEDWLDGLADKLTATCREIDPQSTDETLAAERAKRDGEADDGGDWWLPGGRRGGAGIDATDRVS